MPGIDDLIGAQDSWLNSLVPASPIDELISGNNEWLADYNNSPNIFADPNNTVAEVVATAGKGAGGGLPLPPLSTVAGAVPRSPPTQPSGTLRVPSLPNIPGVTSPPPVTASPPPPPAAHPASPPPPPAPGGAGGAGGAGSPITFPGLGDLGRYAPLLAMIPGVLGAINSKDQTNLGPDAAKMRAMADKNQGLSDQLAAEAEAEKMGNLPGPALASLAASTAEQKAAMRQRYSQMGMSGSSAEGADLAALNQQAEGQRFQIGMGMASEALAQVQNFNTADVGIYKDLMQAQTERDKEYMAAMAELMKGLGTALTQPAQTNIAQTTAGAGGSGTGPGSQVDQRTTGSGPASSVPINPASLVNTTPLTDPLTVALGVDPSTLITPQTTVPDLVPTTSPDLTGINTSGWTPDQVAGADFLSGFPQPGG